MAVLWMIRVVHFKAKTASFCENFCLHVVKLQVASGSLAEVLGGYTLRMYTYVVAT